VDVGWGAGDVEGEVYVVGLLGDEGGVEGGYAIGMGTVAEVVSMVCALGSWKKGAYLYCRWITRSIPI